MLVHAYHRTYGLKTTITRCTNNFGPYQFPEKLIPKAIIRATLGMKVPVYGTGKNIRDWIYVEDHCAAIEKVLQDGRPGEVYNISAGSEMTNIAIVTEILRLIGKPKRLVELVEDRPGHDFRYSLDSSKLRRELGWKPRYSFEAALASTVRWYKQNESWWRPIATRDVLSSTPWKEKW
jgi:dTDP-glucose 4,6-dehydratase